jgi:hypothetical protein
MCVETDAEPIGAIVERLVNRLASAALNPVNAGPVGAQRVGRRGSGSNADVQAHCRILLPSVSAARHSAGAELE